MADTAFYSKKQGISADTYVFCYTSGLETPPTRAFANRWQLGLFNKRTQKMKSAPFLFLNFNILTLNTKCLEQESFLNIFFIQGM